MDYHHISPHGNEKTAICMYDTSIDHSLYKKHWAPIKNSTVGVYQLHTNLTAHRTLFLASQPRYLSYGSRWLYGVQATSLLPASLLLFGCTCNLSKGMEQTSAIKNNECDWNPVQHLYFQTSKPSFNKHVHPRGFGQCHDAPGCKPMCKMARSDKSNHSDRSFWNMLRTELSKSKRTHLSYGNEYVWICYNFLLNSSIPKKMFEVRIQY